MASFMFIAACCIAIAASMCIVVVLTLVLAVAALSVASRGDGRSTTGEALTPPLKHGAWVVHASFSADGTRIVTSCSDGLARVWDVSKVSGTLDELLSRAQMLSSHGLDGTTSLRPLPGLELSNTWQLVRGLRPP